MCRRICIDLRWDDDEPSDTGLLFTDDTFFRMTDFADRALRDWLGEYFIGDIEIQVTEIPDKVKNADLTEKNE